MDWLDEELGGYEDEYLIIDCPGKPFPMSSVCREDLDRGVGQIELYTHHPFLPIFVRHLQRLGIRTCAVYLIESQFMEDKYKFFRCVSRPRDEVFPVHSPLFHFTAAYSQPCPQWSISKSRG